MRRRRRHAGGVQDLGADLVCRGRLWQRGQRCPDPLGHRFDSASGGSRGRGSALLCVRCRHRVWGNCGFRQLRLQRPFVLHRRRSDGRGSRRMPKRGAQVGDGGRLWQRRHGVPDARLGGRRATHCVGGHGGVGRLRGIRLGSAVRGSLGQLCGIRGRGRGIRRLPLVRGLRAATWEVHAAVHLDRSVRQPRGIHAIHHPSRFDPAVLGDAGRFGAHLRGGVGVWRGVGHRRLRG